MDMVVAPHALLESEGRLHLNANYYIGKQARLRFTHRQKPLSLAFWQPNKSLLHTSIPRFLRLRRTTPSLARIVRADPAGAGARSEPGGRGCARLVQRPGAPAAPAAAEAPRRRAGPGRQQARRHHRRLLPVAPLRGAAMSLMDVAVRMC